MGESLTYDDLILLPGYVDFPLESIDLSTKLTRTIRLSIPLVSSPMDTVTEADLAIALAEQGGIGMVHYNMSPERQLAELQAVKQNGLLAGAAVETWKRKAEERLETIHEWADVIVFDTSQGNTSYEIELIQWAKQQFPHLQIIGGNVVTQEGCKALIDAGADAIRVGMGSGSICTTQEVGGIGRGQATAVYECAKVCKSADIPLIADGGIAKTADLVKALCLGADSVMLGSLFACTTEAPGKTRALESGVRLKEYRGMGSLPSMEKGSSHRYGMGSSRLRIPEGVSGYLPSRGSMTEWVPQLVQGIKQGLHKLGRPSLGAKGAVFLERRSEAAKREGGVHHLYEQQKESHVASHL